MMMAIHIVCLTTSGGLPIFSRKKGDCENLPFSTIGSLNGAHMFCKSQGVNLKTTHLEDGVIIVWKEFEKSITLIGSAKGLTENVLRDLLELTFNAMILCVGYNEIKHNKNIERLKREFKNCYPTIDQLLESSENDFLKLSDCCLCTDGQQIQLKLNEFSEQFGSPFCCLLARQKIICGTEGWWDLNIIDRKLLIALYNSSSAIKKDFAVYLPKRSPNIAYRFVSIPLTAGGDIYLCVLCGAQPTIIEIENLAQQIWLEDNMNTLRAIEMQMGNRQWLPSTIQLDSGILGLLLINRINLKYIITHNNNNNNNTQLASSSGFYETGTSTPPGGGSSMLLTTAIRNRDLLKNTSNSQHPHHRLDILRTFFHQSVDVIDKFLNDKQKQKKLLSGGGGGVTAGIDNKINNNRNFKCKENYWITEYHKCHSLTVDDNLICILYISEIPVHTMRLITQRTLNSIICEKNISW